MGAQETPLHLSDLNLEYLSVMQLTERMAQPPITQTTSQGSWCIYTGKRTARSPLDRYICHDALTQHSVDWGKINRPLATNIFQNLWQRALSYGKKKKLYAAHLQVGADPDYALNVHVVTEDAWQCLFAHYLFIDPKKNSAVCATHTTSSHTTAEHCPTTAAWSLLSLPHLNTVPERDNVNSDACIIINFTQKKVLLLGMHYAGEIKKSMFSVQNFLLNDRDVLTMHCAANQGDTGSTALFFGLSGTGKTTLSADPTRHLIGDDEHGWSSKGIFNLENGCYAKVINLNPKHEPEIYSAIRKDTLLENVVIDPKTKQADFYDDRYTQNTRAAFPRQFIDGCVPENCGRHPDQVIFLCCDLYGVLPAVSLLTPQQAAYYFLSGYTTLVGSTEGSGHPTIHATFSPCFGAAFFPKHPICYVKLLQKRLQQTQAKVYLVNTGWHGGSYTTGGTRFSILTTRKIIQLILEHKIPTAHAKTLPLFNLLMPQHLTDLPATLNDPAATWPSANEHLQQLTSLANQFNDNFKQYAAHPWYKTLLQAGPQA